MSEFKTNLELLNKHIKAYTDRKDLRRSSNGALWETTINNQGEIGSTEHVNAYVANDDLPEGFPKLKIVGHSSDFSDLIACLFNSTANKAFMCLMDYRGRIKKVQEVQGVPISIPTSTMLDNGSKLYSIGFYNEGVGVNLTIFNKNFEVVNSFNGFYTFAHIIDKTEFFAVHNNGTYVHHINDEDITIYENEDYNISGVARDTKNKVSYLNVNNTIICVDDEGDIKFSLGEDGTLNDSTKYHVPTNPIDNFFYVNIDGSLTISELNHIYTYVFSPNYDVADYTDTYQADISFMYAQPLNINKNIYALHQTLNKYAEYSFNKSQQIFSIDCVGYSMIIGRSITNKQLGITNVQNLIKSTAGTSNASTVVETPDWLQNDNTATDYIKNRTHYCVDTRATEELTILNNSHIYSDPDSDGTMFAINQIGEPNNDGKINLKLLDGEDEYQFIFIKNAEASEEYTNLIGCTVDVYTSEDGSEAPYIMVLKDAREVLQTQGCDSDNAIFIYGIAPDTFDIELVLPFKAIVQTGEITYSTLDPNYLPDNSKGLGYLYQEPIEVELTSFNDLVSTKGTCINGNIYTLQLDDKIVDVKCVYYNDGEFELVPYDQYGTYIYGETNAKGQALQVCYYDGYEGDTEFSPDYIGDYISIEHPIKLSGLVKVIHMPELGYSIGQLSEDCGEEFNNFITDYSDYRNTASGYKSHAEGESTAAIGYTSHSEGYGSASIGDYSHAEGCSYESILNYNNRIISIDRSDIDQENSNSYYIKATNWRTYNLNIDYSNLPLYAAVFDTLGNISYYNLEYLDYNSDENIFEFEFDDYSNGINIQSIASMQIYAAIKGAIGNASHAEGFETGAFGRYSHAEGMGHFTNNINYIQINYNRTGSLNDEIINLNGLPSAITQIKQFYHSGQNTYYSSGSISFKYDDNYENIILSNSYTNGNSSQYILIYYVTGAFGAASHAEGIGTTAMSDYSHAGGRYNLPSGDYAFVVGNGSVQNLSNAFSLDWYGNAIFGGSVSITNANGDVIDIAQAAMPTVTDDDNGKALVVKNGAWSVELADAEAIPVSYVNSLFTQGIQLADNMEF